MVDRDIPLLVCEDVAANLLLLLLDQVYICEHAVGLEPCGELSSGHCIQVQTREGDELKDEAVQELLARGLLVNAWRKLTPPCPSPTRSSSGLGPKSLGRTN